ncbi:MAG: hypothetical protein KF815_07690 [Rhodospirillales bacterium]|nr:hypothetical protein [Rhodospirillales bacterium]MDG4601222.1 hypothetical protein [Defluviicoccus sp.]MDG4609178.1 hypothetical protein [Defluviicoccus sp.]
MSYVDLDRRFDRLKEGEGQDEPASSVRRWWGDLFGGSTWAELLQSPFIVVQGEAGSGKTSEFRAQVERIRQEQGLAFFVRAEDLVDGKLSGPFDPADEQRLQTWRDGNDEAVFFVDAVDEAKIAHHANVFGKVLTNLRRDLADAKSHARFVISCRVSDWNAQADSEALTNFIHRCRPVADGQVPEPSLVTLRPLDSRRVRKLTEALGVADTDAFMAAVEQAGLEAYCTRPRDVEWLVSFWQQRNRFGSLTEMIEASIEARLREVNEQRTSRDPLSPDHARAGAEALAAALTLGKTFTISLSHSAAQSAVIERSVSAQRALPDWKQAEIDALLTRAIFDPATLGRVRFHHRSTQEYLAACWLVARRKEGMPFGRIRDLMIREAYGTEYAVPSMQAVAGWLAGKMPELRSELLKVEAGILLYEGDAAQIPVEEREAILRRLASRIRSGIRLPWGYGGSPYHRFADPCLAPLILELLRSERDQIHTVVLLLRLVEAGRLAACADAALTMARDETNKSRVRAMAIRAAAAAGNDATRRSLRDLACSAVTLEENITSELFDALCPQEVSPRECLVIVQKTTNRPGYTPLLQNDVENIVIGRSAPDHLPEILEGLLDLASREPMITCYDMLSEQDTGVISERFAWSADAICAVLKRLHECHRIAANAAELIARAYERLIRCTHVRLQGLPTPGTDEPIQWPHEIRKAIFRRIVAALNNNLASLSFVLVWGEHRWFLLNDCDLDWLLHEVSAVDDPPRKTALFELIADLWRDAGRPEHRVTAIRLALENCNPDDSVRRLVEQRLAPPSTEEPKWKKRQRIRQQQQEQKQREQLEESRRSLETRIQGIREATDFDALAWCYEWMHLTGVRGWTKLERDFGTEIAKAVRDGFKTFWRLWWPLLPFEKPEPNRTAVAVYLCLAGLELLFAEGMNADELTPNDAEAAFRYALYHLNGFPEWLDELAAAHPEVVARVVSRQLRAELGPDRSSDTFAFTLSAVRDGPEKVRRLCTRTIAEELEQAIPGSRHALKYALEIVIRSDEAAQRTITSLANRALQAEPAAAALGSAALVLAAWLQVDPDAALNYLERQRQANNNAANTLFLALASHFGSDWRPEAPLRTETWTPEVLERLVLLSMAYISPAEDNPLREDAYSPNARDYAEDFRRSIINLLVKKDGPEAHNALLRLSDAREIPEPWRDNFEATASSHAANTTECGPWSEAEVVQFAALHERDPATAEELFRIALDRLKDIKDDIEKGDFSDRALFQPKMAEETMQKWLAGRLERESRRRYSVVRETEVDQRKKPDIRLYNPRAGYVSVEIKPVDERRYTYNELGDALENQLVGQYMRAAGSRHGVLVIGMLEVRQWVPGDGSGKIGFEDLIKRLDDEAAALVRERSDIDDLKVIGIDFCGPQSVPTAAESRTL